MAALTLVSLFQATRIDEKVAPLGCLWLKATLEAAGIGCELRDMQFLPKEVFNDPDRLLAALGDTHDLVGISCMSDALPLAVALGRRIKERHPHKVLIYGGWGPSTVAAPLVRTFPWIDFVVRGEGEHTIVELVRAIGGGDPARVLGIDGRWRGELVHTADRPNITDVAGLPEPPVTAMAGYSYYTTLTARGCPYGCRFCEIPTMESRQLRARSVDAVVAEVARAHHEHGVDYVGFNDDIFLLSRKRVDAILDGMERAGASVKWACFARAGRVDGEWLASLKARGLDHVSFGVEAGSDTLLKRVDKRMKLDLAMDAVAWTVKEVKVRCFFLWGFPDETLEDFFGTAQAIFHADALGADASVGQVVPLPGSPLALAYDGPLVFAEEYPFCRVMKPPKQGETLAMIREHPGLFPAFYSFETPHRAEKWALATQLCCRA